MGTAYSPSKVNNGQTPHSRGFWNLLVSQVHFFPRNLSRSLRGTEPGDVGLRNPSEVPNVDFESEVSVKKAGLLSKAVSV